MICNESGLPKFGASAEFLGQESLFRPALNGLETHDRVGVAHWCDNNDTQLDLPPTEDHDEAIQQLSKTSGPLLSREVRPPATRLENRLSVN